MLQPLDANSEKDRSKHKFMVQSAYVTEAQLKDKQPLESLVRFLCPFPALPVRCG